MLAPYQKYLLTNSNKWFISDPYGIHNEYQETRSYTPPFLKCKAQYSTFAKPQKRSMQRTLI